MPVYALADGHKHKEAFEYSAVIAYCSGAAFARINNYTWVRCPMPLSPFFPAATSRSTHWWRQTHYRGSFEAHITKAQAAELS
jgi:hypothetical protein